MREMLRRPGHRTLAALAVGLALAGATGIVQAKPEAQPQPSSSPAPCAGPKPESPPKPPRFEEVIARMSPAGRTLMDEAVRKGEAEQQYLEWLKETREEIIRLLAAPTLDAQALEGAFVRERKLSFRLQAARHDALLKAARRLSPEDRQIFAEGLRATRLHMPGETVRQIQKTRDACADTNGSRKTRQKP